MSRLERWINIHTCTGRFKVSKHACVSGESSDVQSMLVLAEDITFRLLVGGQVRRRLAEAAARTRAGAGWTWLPNTLSGVQTLRSSV